MPGSHAACSHARRQLVAAVQTAAVLLATRAVAAPTRPVAAQPTASSDPCDLISAPPRTTASKRRQRRPGRSGPTNPLTDTLDPLSSLAKGCADAAAWTVDKLSKAVERAPRTSTSPTPTFLQQYAVVFAASTILTLLLWLLAVAKRAVRGVPLTTASPRPIGFLWLTVLASAFTPLILYTVVSATDGVTEVIATAHRRPDRRVLRHLLRRPGQGRRHRRRPDHADRRLPGRRSSPPASSGWSWSSAPPCSTSARCSAPSSTPGLVDKNLWGHVRRWAGIMIAVILVKPVIVIVLGLAGALSPPTTGPTPSPPSSPASRSSCWPSSPAR